MGFCNCYKLVVPTLVEHFIQVFGEHCKWSKGLPVITLSQWIFWPEWAWGGGSHRRQRRWSWWLRWRWWGRASLGTCAQCNEGWLVSVWPLKKPLRSPSACQRPLTVERRPRPPPAWGDRTGGSQNIGQLLTLKLFSTIGWKHLTSL